MPQYYARVILPVPLRLNFTYSVPDDIVPVLQPGMRVSVPLGPKKIYAGIVKEIHTDRPDVDEIKPVLSVLDSAPVVNRTQLDLWRWMSSYYLCTEGDVMACALPSGFKLDSETVLVLNPDFAGDVSMFNERQLDILSAINLRGEITLEQAAKAASQAKVFPLVQGLRSHGAVLVKEETEQRYRPLQEDMLRWSGQYRNNEEAQAGLFNKLEKRAYKQMEVLMAYVSLCGAAIEGWVAKERIAEKVKDGAAAVQALVKKGVLETKKQNKSRLGMLPAGSAPLEPPPLSEAQQKCYNQIREGLQQKDVCLLHGVTSSGKTEIYIHMIKEVLKQGKQALFLLPEIALSAQMILRLRKYFGNEVGVYHSRYNEAEKVEIWQNTSNRYKVILGARSALFLPYENLGLIIVDEEHDGSYKQADPAPRYQARDTAVYLAKLHGAKVVLGSATPSVESYYNALHGKYALATLFTRYGGVQLPDVYVSNLREEKQAKTMHANFSSFLTGKITDALEAGKQVILFQNRRGFAYRLECADCGYTPACKHCDVTLTYHKTRNVLMCHYCGYTVNHTSQCPQCGGHNMKLRGFGTERLQEDLEVLFPGVRIGRMDLDSTRNKGSYYKIIDDFQKGRIQILVGTQMVTKGLDFDNVALVGIIDADGLIAFPDFRSYERSFQLMTQVSGRAGRRGGGGEVVIQTHKPEYAVIQQVINNDYASMYKDQLNDRLTFKYPPFYRLVRISLRHKDQDTVWNASRELGENMRAVFGQRVLGPEYPMVSRISTYYIRELMLKIERGAKVEEMKKRLRDITDNLSAKPEYKSVRIILDVDP